VAIVSAWVKSAWRGIDHRKEQDDPCSGDVEVLSEELGWV
jgi:hypothetical protein